MDIEKTKTKIKIWIILILIIILFVSEVVTKVRESFVTMHDNRNFNIITTYENKDFEDDLVEYGKKNKMNVNITYAGDLEIIDRLNDGKKYDAVWISNSIWLYMLNSDVSIKNSKSISINPVVFGIKKSVARELGFVDKDISNKDIIDAIRYKSLKYVMPSVTKTNAGATAYLGFLHVLSGANGILTEEALDSATLKDDLVSLFSGVERVSGTEDFLESMFLKSDDYEAVVSSETSLIRINQQLVKKGKEPLYLVYPKDGVAINDSPFAYIDHGQKKEDKFDILQKYLLSEEGTKKLESLGRRVWYGGINKDADKNIFNKEWGIDTNKYLMSLRYPSKAVIDKSLKFYVESLRKPSIVVFCLDFSGSMIGNGITQLMDAMSYILNYEESSKDLIQFTDSDIVYIIPFNHSTISKSIGGNLNEQIRQQMLQYLTGLIVSGGTNIYNPTIEALKIIDDIPDNDKYTKTVILMTDGYSNNGNFMTLKNYYVQKKLNIPIYSIMFGSSSEEQLTEIAELTNAKIFDGVSNLKEAFKEVRGFN